MRIQGAGRGLRTALLSMLVVLAAAVAMPSGAFADTDSPYTVVVSAGDTTYPQAPTFQLEAFLGTKSLADDPDYELTGKAQCSKVYATPDAYYGATTSAYGVLPGSWRFASASCQSYDVQTGLDVKLKFHGGTVPFKLQGGPYTVKQSPTVMGTSYSTVAGPSGGDPTSVTFSAFVGRGEGSTVAGLPIQFAFMTQFGLQFRGCTATTTDDGNGQSYATCTITGAVVQEFWKGTGVYTATFAGSAAYVGASVTTTIPGGHTTIEAASAARIKATSHQVTIEPHYIPPGCVNPLANTGDNGSLLAISIGMLSCKQLSVLQALTGVSIGVAATVITGGAAAETIFSGFTLSAPQVIAGVARQALLAALNAAYNTATGGRSGRSAPHGRASLGATPATNTMLTPNALTVDAAGNLYIGDLSGHVVRKVTPTGDLSTVAGVEGNGGPIAAGPATASQLSNPGALALDRSGDLLVADGGANQVLAKVTSGTGALSILAGTAGQAGPVTSGPATSSALHDATGVAVDATGNIYVADSVNGVIEKITPGGTLSVVAGLPGTFGTVKPGPATSSPLWAPGGVAVDAAGNLYIADTGNATIDKVSAATGELSVVAGTPRLTGVPSEGAAEDSQLGAPNGVALDADGNLYIADPGAGVVEKIAKSTGALSIVAGTPGTVGAPTPGPATASALVSPAQVALDGAGNLYIADTFANVVEKVTPGGTLSIVAGTGATNPITDLQQRGLIEINQEAQVLGAIGPSLTPNPWLSQANEDRAFAIIADTTTGLATLATQLAADQTAADADAHYRAIATTYAVYGLRLPQLQLATSADNLLHGSAEALDAARQRLVTLLAGPASTHNTADVQAKLADLQTQITAVRDATTGLAATVLAFTPAQYA
ncbi:MAG: hypothetical protein REI11_08935, partial [Patulibacter sp.]|nr:hypothetical protein [Patulibacter sp.]